MLSVAVVLLWVLLVVLLFGLLATLADGSMTLGAKSLAVALLAVLIFPVAKQLRASHRQMREMTANRIVLGPEGVEIQLSGRAREWKGLPDVEHTTIAWDGILSIVREKRRFAYPSAIPMGYPLEVYTLYSKAGGISFTRECIPNAKMVAQEIAAKIGNEI